MTIVYLAWGSASTSTLERHANDEPVNLLVAYPFLKQFLKVRDRFNVGRWCLDSGAFSAFHSGHVIDLDEYNGACLDVLSLDQCPAAEVFGLDVIQDPWGGKRNLEYAWKAGVPAIPTWHGGDPVELLDWAASSAEKIAVSGSGLKRADGLQLKDYIGQAFARVWPKKIHGFAMASRRMLRSFPFHSVDASSWTYAPAAMGMWAGFTGKQMRVGARGIRDYWIEVVEHQKREKEAAWLWRRELRRANDATLTTVPGNR